MSESRTCSMVRYIFDCDHAVPSRALGSVKRVVGNAVERPEGPVGQSLRYADTHSNLQVGGDGVERAFRQFGAHSLTQAAEIRPRDPAYTKHEFLAAQPPRMAIMRGFEGLQLVCQQDQRFVARLMPELVIDRLKAINIDQDETKGHRGPPPEILGAPGQESPAIQEPGQGIALGELGEALTRRNRGVALNPKRPQPRG
ncbi:MAG: hypothetical protein ABF282_11640, partial [Qipengyuania flava]